MADVLNLTIPMFSLIGIGYLLKRIQFMSEQDGTVLSKFAFYILLPPLMFTSILSGDASKSLNINFIFSYEIMTIFIFAVTYLLGSILKLKTMEKGIFGLNSAYPNYGYIGVPLCILAFGAEAAIPLALILLADTFVLLTIYVCESDSFTFMQYFVSIFCRPTLEICLSKAFILGNIPPGKIYF